MSMLIVKQTRTLGLNIWPTLLACLPGLACGAVSPNSGQDEEVGSLESASTLSASATLWSKSGGVVSIPTQVLTYEQGGVLLSEQNFLPVLQYIQATTHNQFQFVQGATSGSRMQFGGKASWSSSGASCTVGKSNPTSCKFRMSSIVGVAHRKDGSADPIRVYYADGTYRRATLDDLLPVAPCTPAPCTDLGKNTLVNYPINPSTGVAYTPDDVAAIEQSGASMIVWYRNGFTSKGSETDLGATIAPRSFTGYTYQEGPFTVALPLVAVAVSANGKVHAFWRDPRDRPVGQARLLHTLGTSSTELVGAAANQNYAVIPPGESLDEIVGTVYDETNTLNTYFANTKERYIGSRGNLGEIGQHNVKMASARDNFSTILHEVMHGLGITHEHQRPDRDTYLNVTTNDAGYPIQPSATTVGGYDFASIMHYDSDNGFLRRGDNSPFSKNYTSFSWRDLRGLLVHYGFTDPQSTTAAENTALADFNAASASMRRATISSPATGHISGDILAMDVEGSGPVRTYYVKTSNAGVRTLTGSRGTAYDLGRYTVGGVEEFAVTAPKVNGVAVAPTDIVALAISDGEAITWFKSAAQPCASGLFRSRGSYTALDSVWPAACVALPAGYTANRLRDVARHRYGGITHIVAIYDDGKFSVGGTTDLASESQGVFSVALGDVLNATPVEASVLQGFAILNNGAQFYMGCDLGDDNCDGYEYQFINVPDFVSRLPAQFQ